jgi:hypothetical protein
MTVLIQISFAFERNIRFNRTKYDHHGKTKYQNDIVSFYQFADVPNFDINYIYPTAFSPNAVGIQMLQNFFNWFSSSVFWLTFLSFYKRLDPIFAPSHFQREDSRTFGDIPSFNATEIWQLAFYPESVATQMTQNFFNFFNSAMFWLLWIPFYERLSPIFATNKTADSREDHWQSRSADIPDFNVTNIYYTVYSPNGIAVQLLQNTFVWFTSSLFWLYFTPFYSRLAPIFSVANQVRNSQNV